MRYVVGLCFDQGPQPGKSHVHRLLRIRAGCQALRSPMRAFQRLSRSAFCGASAQAVAHGLFACLSITRCHTVSDGGSIHPCWVLQVAHERRRETLSCPQ